MKKKLIAETACHHQGDHVFMLDLIEALCASQADCIKIHLLFDIDEYMHSDHSLYGRLKDWMLPERVWQDVTAKIKSAGKELIALCNDRLSLDFALAHGASGLELHAVTVHDVRLQRHALELVTQRNVLFFAGVGAVPLEELDALYDDRNGDMVMMFGIQNFPTKLENIALAKQRRLMKLYPRASFGYADHTEWDHPDNLLISLLGGLDKTYVEKHVSITPGKQRIDFESAISVEQLDQLRLLLNMAEELEGDGRLVWNSGEQQYGAIGPMRKAMIAVRDIQAGEAFDFKSVQFQRTARISDLLPSMVEDNTGHQFVHDVKAGAVIDRSDLQKQKKAKS